MSRAFDMIVVGLGAMGSATALHLARRGLRVLGLDQFQPPHALGSSHGESRIIREAYFEHPAYVPLVQRAYQLWENLERESGRPLLRTTGGLMIGLPGSVVVSGAQHSAQTHQLACECLSAAQVRKRFPALRPEAEMSAVWEPRAGVLDPEACVAAHLRAAQTHGATLRFDEPVRAWEPDGQGVAVMTDRSRYEASRLVLAAGPWLNTLLPRSPMPLRVERQVMFWFEPEHPRDRFNPDQCPVHLWEYERGRFFYGFPNLGHGVKVAFHHRGEETTPDSVRREVAENETDIMRSVLRRFLPGAAGRLLKTAVCLYTRTPDEHFLIDTLEHPRVLALSPCSGHGFKFSSVVGEIAAALACEETPPFDLSLFRRRSPR